jgi:hypothetical protein
MNKGIDNDPIELELMVAVKAYPSISQTYGEAVCVAGVRLDTPKPEWVRLYPVRYRELPVEKQFKKYEVIRLRARKHSSDRRRESFRPDEDSIQRLRSLPAGAHWPMRRQLVEPLIGPTMCELGAGRRGGAEGPSLGLVRPARVSRLQLRPAEEWSLGQKATAGQGNLLTEKTELEKLPFTFAYEWTCQEPRCKGHLQSIADWELSEAYRSWQRKGYDPVAAIRSRWLDEICAASRETYFFVGDQHQRPGKFLVLGTFYPKPAPHRGQLTLV